MGLYRTGMTVEHALGSMGLYRTGMTVEHALGSCHLCLQPGHVHMGLYYDMFTWDFAVACLRGTLLWHVYVGLYNDMFTWDFTMTCLRGSLL